MCIRDRHTPPLMVFCRVFGYIAHFIGAVEKGILVLVDVSLDVYKRQAKH